MISKIPIYWVKAVRVYLELAVSVGVVLPHHVGAAEAVQCYPVAQLIPATAGICSELRAHLLTIGKEEPRAYLTEVVLISIVGPDHDELSSWGHRDVRQQLLARGA
jgi:hypothetical protein